MKDKQCSHDWEVSTIRHLGVTLGYIRKCKKCGVEQSSSLCTESRAGTDWEDVKTQEETK